MTRTAARLAGYGLGWLAVRFLERLVLAAADDVETVAA